MSSSTPAATSPDSGLSSATTPSASSPTSSSTDPAASSTAADPTSAATPTSASSAQSSATSDSASSTTSASSTSSSSTDSTTPSSTSSSQTSSSTPTSTSATSVSQTLTPTQQLSTQVSETVSDGSTIQVTKTITSSGTPSTTVAAAQDTTSKGFFHNKGAVAGVFAVVGLVALVIAIAFITNAVRRRRAKKFDREIADAADEARKASADPSLFHQDDDFTSGYDTYSGGLARSRSVYTDHTHGTYSQQPLRPVESYGMSELNVAAGDPYAAAGVGGGMAGMGAALGGAAGNAGIGAAGLNRSRSTTAPYNAFAGPGGYPRPVPRETEDPFYDAPPMPTNFAAAYGQPLAHSQAGLFEATGLGAAGASAAATGVNLARGPSQHQASLSRSGSRTLDHAMDPYAATPYYPPQPPRSASPPPMPFPGESDPYGGYATASPTHDTFVVTGPPEHEEGEEEEEEPPYREYEHEHDVRESMGDEADYGYDGGRRVLKVANE